MKKCNKCLINKNLENFHLDIKSKDGFRHTCKECIKKYNNKYKKENEKSVKNKLKLYYIKNKEKLKKKHREYYIKNSENKKEYKNKYYNEHREEIKLSEIKRQKTYKLNNSDKISIRNKNYRNNNKEKINEYKIKNSEKNKKYQSEYRTKNKKYFKKYYNENKEKINKTTNKRIKEKLISCPLYKLTKNIRVITKRIFKIKKIKKELNSEKILGCSFYEFKIYLENKFEPWMNWDNYGKYNGELNYGWDIDHIIPVSSAKTKEDVYKLAHYTNLQPLCSYTNRYIKINHLNIKQNNI